MLHPARSRVCLDGHRIALSRAHAACFLLHICSRRVWWERPVYHRGVPSPLARSARSASGRGRGGLGAGDRPGSPRRMGSLDAPRVTKICCPPAADNKLPASDRPPRILFRVVVCSRGKILTAARHHRTQGKNYSQGTIAGTGGNVTGGVMRPLKTGAAGSASCPSCPPTTTGGRDRRFPPSVSSSQLPRPPSLNSLWAQPTVATAPPVAAREAVAEPVGHSAVWTRVALRPMRRSHGSRSPPSAHRHRSPGRGSRNRCLRAPQTPAAASIVETALPAHAPAPASSSRCHPDHGDDKPCTHMHPS